MAQKTQTRQKAKVVQARRQSTSFRRVFESREAAVQMASKVESSPLFQQLREMGLLEKKALLGHIPQDKRQSFHERQEREANKLLVRYGLDRHPDLNAALFEEKNKVALKRFQEYAVSVRAPLHEVEKALKAIQKASRERLSFNMASLDEPDASEVGVSDPQEYAAVPVLMDVQKLCIHFCTLYKVSERDFQAYFLASDAQDYSVEEVAEELDCPERSVREIRDMLAEIISPSPDPDDDSDPDPIQEEEGQCVARVALKDNSWVITPMRQREVYVVSGRVETVLGKEQKSQWQALQEEIRALNALADKRVQALDFICRRQSAFLMTGDPADLAPLSQREIAVAIGCAPDRTFRMLFDDNRKDSSKAHRRRREEREEAETMQAPYFLLTPRGRVFLRDLLQELDEVVPRLKRKYPSYSDNRISTYLKERFGVYRTREAVRHAHKRGSGTLGRK